MNLIDKISNKLLNLIEKFERGKEIYSILILIFLIIIFMFPAILGKEYILRVDSHKQALPRLIAVSRSLQNGELPLWDSCCFLGARPFYAMYESPIYNILLYPFYLLANHKSEVCLYYELFLLPYILFLLISALGTYFFSRFVIKINKISSLIMALVYTISPHMGISMMSLHNTAVFAYIPWILFACCKFIETKKIIWWVSGVISLALLATGCNTNFTLRAYFITALIIFLAWLFIYRKEKKSLITFGFVIFIYIFSVILASVMWLSIFEGLSWLLNETKFTYNEIISYFTSNVWPGHLITLFIPHYNGLNPGTHAWGNAIGGDHNILFTGGLFISFSIFIGFIFCILNKSKIKDTLYSWIVIGFIIYFLSILVMMGKYTPVYKILCIIFPWFFEIPYPFYYEFAQGWAASLLAGCGIFLLFLSSNEIYTYLFKKKYIIFYILIVTIFCIIPLFEKFHVNLLHDVFYTSPRYQKILEIINKTNRDFFYSWESLLFLKNLKWFILNPLLYFIIFLFLVVLFLIFYKKSDLIKIAIIIGLVFDIYFFGYITFFKNTNTAYIEERTLQEYWTQMRVFTIKQHPFYNVVELVKNISKEDKYRWINVISDRDNMAWITNGRAVFGYDSKPILPEMKNIIDKFMQGYPYELYSHIFPVIFLKNINVKYLIIPDGLIENEIKIKEINGMKVYEIYDHEKLKEKERRGFNFFTLIKSEKNHLVELDEPLPYIFTQNKIKKVNNIGQLDYLINEDLRKFVVINKEIRANFDSNNSLNNNKDEKYIDEFNELQTKNKIKILKRTSNKLELEADIQTPAVLVRNEMFHKGWKVTVNGEKKELLKVNYMMQGVWLDKGKYLIKFSFMPDSFKTGLIISIITIFVLLVLLVFDFFTKKNKKVNAYLQ